MKKAALLVAGIFFVLIASAQQEKPALAGNGNIITQKRQVPTEYTNITITGPFEVILTSGEMGSISIEGDSNIVDIVTSEVNNGTLTIATQNAQPFKASRSRKTKIKLPAGHPEKISLNGCGSIVSKSCIKSQKIKTAVDGPGSISLTVSSTETEASVLGSGTITLKGYTDNLSGRIVGSGTVKAYDLETKDVNAFISGSGNIKVNCTYAIRGRIIGTGNIAFSGEPRKTDLKFMGSGSFIKD